jgi:hypothetical protein
MGTADSLTFLKYIIFALAAGATGFLCAFFWESIRGGRAQVETHWGGFGGGLRGWRISQSLLYLFGALAFAALRRRRHLVDKTPVRGSVDGAGECKGILLR